MPELTTQDVTALARAIGLTLQDQDLVEVTHRLNVILNSMHEISHPDLDELEPVPFIPLAEWNDG